jgi:hypothetical protein
MFEPNQDVAKSYNQLANSNVKLLCLPTDDDVVLKAFSRPKMVSCLDEMPMFFAEKPLR